MNSAFKLIAAVAAVCAATSAAHADPWNGFYVGATVGLDSAHYNAKSSTETSSSPGGYFDGTSVGQFDAVGSANLAHSGYTESLEGGWNRQNGSFVWGIEGDIGALNGEAHSTANGYFTCCDVAFTNYQKVSTTWNLTVRPRAGWLMGNTYFYGTGGVAAEGLKYEQIYNDAVGATESASKSDTKIGWVVGAGVEFPLGTGWTMKAEYLYEDIGSIGMSSTNLTYAGTNYPGNAFTDSASNIHTSMFRLGVNVHL